MRKVFSESKLESEPTAVHIAAYVPQFRCYPSLEGTLEMLNSRNVDSKTFVFEKFSAKTFRINQKFPGWRINATNASFSIPQPALGCNTCCIRPEECRKVTLVLWKKLGFQWFLPKCRRRKISVHKKFLPRSIATLRIQLCEMQTYTTNSVVEEEHQS